jgi:hypothetical protein
MKNKTSRISIMIKLLSIVIVVIACNIGAALNSTAPDKTDTPPAAPTNTTTIQIPTATTPSQSNIYMNDEYQFAFDIPKGWVLEEGTWEEAEGMVHYIHLTNDPFRIALHFKTVFEEVFIGPRGMAPGEFSQLDQITVFNQEVVGYRHSLEGKTKMLLYRINTEELRLFAGLDMLQGPGIEYLYEDIDIPAEIQSDFITLVGTLRRTGSIELPESVALLADIPLILSLEKTYYSQIYDTDVANACGPAAALMVLEYYGVEDSMDAVIESLQNLPSPGAFDPGCYENTVCTSPDALTMLFYQRGLQVNSHEDWTLAEIFAVISQGHPVIADILWDPETASLGHFVVIYGVDMNEEEIYYHDPYRGRELITAWDDFAILWEGRVDIGDPLRPEGHQFWGVEIHP